ncbi:MAG: hypothetical protein KDA17_05165 [Candidatus Saccharibacteria bacterium]|nr:hypothetical protein [Candidatus Saccharibacteria bacterium]
MSEISEKGPPTSGKWVGDVWVHVGVVLHCADNGRYDYEVHGADALPAGVVLHCADNGRYDAYLFAGGRIAQLDHDDRLAYVCEIARRLNQWQQEHGE